MTKNNLNEEKKAINKVNSLLTTKPAKKKTWWAKFLHLGRLFGDVGEYVFDEEAHAEKIKQDILKIESERLEDKRRLDLERQKIEEQARQEAQKKTKAVKTPWFKTDKNFEPQTAADRLQSINLASADLLNDDTPSLALESAPELQTAARAIPTAAEIANELTASTAPISTTAPATPAEVSVVEEKPAKSGSLSAGLSELSFDENGLINLELGSQNKDLRPIIIEQKIKKSWFGNAIEPTKTSKEVETKPKPSPKLKASVPVKPAEKKPTLFTEHKVRAAKRLSEELAKEYKLFTKNEVENRYWQSFNIIRANLIKEQKSLFFNWKGKILNLVFFAVASLLVVLMAYLYLIVRQQQKINDNKSVFDNLESINQQIKNEELRLQEINYFSDSLLYVSYLLDNHVYWSRFFSLLEKRTIPEVYYESFSGDLNGVYKIPGVAKDFSSITTQTKVLLDVEGDLSVFGADTVDATRFEAKPQVPASSSETEKKSRSVKNGDITFTLNLTINPSAVFLRPNDTVTK